MFGWKSLFCLAIELSLTNKLLDCSFDQLRSCFGQWWFEKLIFFSWLQNNVAIKEDQRTGWVGTDHKDHLVLNPIPCAGMHPTRTDNSKPVPT